MVLEILYLQCSKSCNNGYQRRSAVCMDTKQERKLPPHECVQEKPLLIQKCNPKPCPAWHAGNWSGVSKLLLIQKCNPQPCPVWHAGNWRW